MADGMPTPPVQPAHIQDLIASRRGVLMGLASLPFLTLADEAGATAPRTARALSFAPVPPTVADTVTVPAGYRVQTLIGWGDALYEGMAPFNPNTLTRADQENRFGQNNDMLALFPTRFTYPKATNQNRFLLCANHEYFDPTLMFPAVARPTDFTADQIAAMFASMGVGIVQVEQQGGTWRVIREAKSPRALNRRITPFTPVAFEGPAKDHPWIVAAGQVVNRLEPGAGAGQIACGTMANCAGGETPWGTYLTSEENFQSYYFNSNSAAAAPAAPTPASADATSFGYPLTRTMARPGTPAQFDLATNPTGPALYGWVVEIDPYDPTSTPRKRTALGRRKGECATTALTRGRKVAVYAGDDQGNEFVYKFISARRFNPRNRRANIDLLDTGTLYVAKLEADGSGRWLALTVDSANAASRAAGATMTFANQGDVVVMARQAARLLGATPMDRPEDVEAIRTPDWTGTGSVLVVCTNNRAPEAAALSNGTLRDGATAGPNVAGHIIQINEDGGDCGALTFRWDVFALAGDPDAAGPTPLSVVADGRPTFSGDRFACPDNVCFDTAHHAWITTDGNDGVFADCNDGVVVTPTAPQPTRPVKRFLVGPVGAEICGPMLSPDERAFLCAIQHPGEGDTQGRSYSQTRWGGAQPPSNFPDGPGTWPRSAVVVVTKDDGGVVGT